MRFGSWVGVTAVVLALTISGCGSEPAPEVTTGSLPAAANAALDCATSMRHSLEPDSAIIYMLPDATSDQIEAVRSMLARDSNLRDVTYRTQDEALAEFKELFVDSPEMVEAVTASLLPSSFRFAVATPSSSPTSTGDPLARYRTAPGVKSVVYAPTESRCAATDPAMLKAAQRMIDNRYGSNGLIVYMDPNSDQAGLATMREELLAMPAVRGLVFVSQEQSLEEFTCLFKDSPDMIAEVTADILPSSFRVDVGTDEALITRTADGLKRRPGVKQVMLRPTPSQLLAAELAFSADDGLFGDADCRIDGERIK